MWILPFLTQYYTDDTCNECERNVHVQFTPINHIRELFERKISFVTRMKGNKTLYKEIIEDNLDTLETKENLTEYNGRYVYLKCVPCEVDGYNAYAYIGLDIERKSSEAKKMFLKAKDNKMTTGEVFKKANDCYKHFKIQCPPVIGG